MTDERGIILHQFVTKDGIVVLIRNLIRNELTEVNDLLPGLFDEPRNSVNELRTRKLVQDKFQKYCSFFIGAFIENKIVGMLLGWPQNSLLGLHAIAVLEDYRRKGIGTALLRTFEKVAEETGFDNYVLGARKQAIPFYASIGLTFFVNILVKLDHIQWNRLVYLKKKYDVVDVVFSGPLKMFKIIDRLSTTLCVSVKSKKNPNEYVAIRIKSSEINQEMLEEIRKDFNGYSVKLCIKKRI